MLFGNSKKNLFFNPGNRESGVDEDTMRDEVDHIKEEDVEVVLENEEAINKKFSGPNSLSKYAELGKVMLAMLRDFKNGTYKGVPWFTIATIVLGLLYILNPMDIIPDFIPGVGYIDDLAVLSIGMGWIESDLHRYLDWRLHQAKE